ncbi:MAG: phosphoribosylformylglycinamidine cyclo-ligase [Chloroflexi bacterium]|nr:phosphoribosylformylglycinamidine cyclo-ligase [Chloroflexota bacterium]
MNSYAAAGVDLDAAAENVRRLAGPVRGTHGVEVLGDFGAFAGLYHLRDVRDPVLVASTDGIGTKLLLGIERGAYDVLGRDLVNLSVDDVITSGARPLFFLDYLAVSRLDHQVVDALIGGIAAACRENGCALLGGETAQLPDLYQPDHFDLAGAVVGVVERDRLILGTSVSVGDAIWGWPSTGLHTNGYSLARRIVAEAGLDLDGDPSSLLGTSLGAALLAPHPSYWPRLEPLLGTGQVRAIAHITGGGVPGNLPRVLPDHVSAELSWGSWPIPPIFDLLGQAGHISFGELWRVFNLGLGMLVVASGDLAVPGALRVGTIVDRRPERVLLLNAPAGG